MRNERDQVVNSHLFMDLMHPPISDRRFWLAQALIAAALLVHLGADLARDHGITAAPGFVWILLLFVPVVYAGSTFGFIGSVSVALEGFVLSIPQELLLAHSETQLWGAWSILAMVVAVAILLGVYFDKERERHALDLAAEHLETKKRFQLAFENNVAGMTITDLSRRILAVNRSFCMMLGRSSEEILGLDTDAFTYPRDRDIANDWTMRMLAGEQSEVIYAKRFIHKDGHVVWVEVSRSLARDKDNNPQYFINSVRDITEERLLLAKLSHQALHDPLTGLANRAMFEDRLTHALSKAFRKNTKVAVLLVDLDEFKYINDTFGHQIGDDLLVEVARRLEKLTRSADTLCRFGGDEFLYLCEGISNPSEAEAIAARLLGAFDEPFPIGEYSLNQAASIGLAIGGGWSNSVDLVRDADAALAVAKRQGKNRYTLFRSKMQDQVSNRIGLVKELRRSFDSDEILMHYQPIVDLATSQIVGVEALMRWNHPEYGWVSPHVFLPLAERSELVFDLGSLALRQAVSEAASWRYLDRRDQQPYVSANLSPRQFHDPELLRKVKEVLEANEFAPSRLILEITERAVFVDIDSATRVASGLRQLGVSLAIDDFGTSYSSLSHLTLLRPGLLKVQQSCLNPSDSSANGKRLLEAVIAIGRTLDAIVVAKGIETMTQVEMLRGLGYNFGQGHLFSPAVPSADLVGMLETVQMGREVPTSPHDPANPK